MKHDSADPGLDALKSDMERVNKKRGKSSKGFASVVKIERSFGLATGFDDVLPKLQRFMEYQLARFLNMHGQTGRWTIMAWCSREEVTEACPPRTGSKASKSAK